MDYTVQFNNESKGNFDKVFWHFETPTGDNGQSSEFSPRADSVPNGFMHVCLTVFDSVSGCQADYCEGVQVGELQGADCFPEFSFRVDSGYIVHFNNESEGNFDHVWWEFSWKRCF